MKIRSDRLSIKSICATLVDTYSINRFRRQMMWEETLNLDEDQITSVDEMVVQISLANLTILRNKIHSLEDHLNDHMRINKLLEKQLKEKEENQ